MNNILHALYYSNVWMHVKTISAIARSCKSMTLFMRKLIVIKSKYDIAKHYFMLCNKQINQIKQYCNYTFYDNILNYNNKKTKYSGYIEDSLIYNIVFLKYDTCNESRLIWKAVRHNGTVHYHFNNNDVNYCIRCLTIYEPVETLVEYLV